eukprot:TRINITY_DN7189_c0_g1_i2.p2 TRINITY_DN7189_c0_g1~~TRINITY_DN7189_c0_g1_i2.p2  ORF type:complete len:108 (-),score=14.87 TRINITY_DN7189_c0_g1_i2:299-622(-)
MPPLTLGRRNMGEDFGDELRPINIRSKNRKPQPAIQQESETFRGLDAKDILPFGGSTKVSFSFIGFVVLCSSLIGLWSTGVMSTSPAPAKRWKGSKGVPWLINDRPC